MPRRIEMWSGEGTEVCGYLSPVYGKDGFFVFAVGDHEEDTPADVRSAARRWRKQFDRNRKSAKDIGNSGSVN